MNKQTSLRFIYEGGKRKRVMHIQATNNAGQSEMKAICGIDHNFNRTINVPLGRKICSNCKRQIK